MESNIFPLSATKRDFSIYVFAVVLAVLLACAALIIFHYVPVSYDWHDVFYPAGQAFFHGKNPYLNPYFFNPPWALIFLSPLLLLPEHAGATLVILFQLVGFGFVAFKLGAKPLGIAAVILTEPVLVGSVYGNIDWLIMLGLIMPPQIGLFFVLLKPQIGIGIAIYWLWKAWREKGVREVLRVFGPVSIAFLISFLIYGFYPLHFSKTLGFVWNFSAFPYSIPVGLGLLFFAFWKNRPTAAAASGIFLSPYVNIISYSIIALAFIRNTRLTVLICVLSWLIIFVPILKASFFGY